MARRIKENSLEVVSVRLVKDKRLYGDYRISSPQDAIQLMQEEMKTYDREVVCILNLRTDGTVINMNVASQGTLNAAMVHPREVFKASILSNASSIIALHNHPSGNSAPSREDIDMTKRLKESGELLGIHLLDHIIVGGYMGEVYSFKEHDLVFNSDERAPFGSREKEASDVREASISRYGKDRFDHFLKRSVDADFVLYASKEKTQALSACAKLQLLGALPPAFEFDKIIHKSNNIVNDREENVTMEGKTNENKRVYLNVHKNYAKIDEPRANGNGTYNQVTLPKGVAIDDKDLSYGRIYPDSKYIYPNKFNPNLTTVQYLSDQKVPVNLPSGRVEFIKGRELAEAVDQANRDYVRDNKERIEEAEKQMNKQASKSRIREKDNEVEME